MTKTILNSQITIILLINWLLLFIQSPLAVKSQANSVSCQISAYVIDSDPRGLNVRRSPSANSSIIDKLPLHTEVQIFFGRGKWVLVSWLEPEENYLNKKGWVFASLLGLYTKGYGKKNISLYEEPTQNSRIVAQVPSDTEVTLLGCSGEWVLIQKGKIQGWLEPSQQCSSPFTTCP